MTQRMIIRIIPQTAIIVAKGNLGWDESSIGSRKYSA
jgi:hypothetical protein